MKRFFKIFIILFILTIFYLYIANLCLMPKSITLLQGEKLKLATLWGVSLTQPNKDIYDDKQNIETLQTSSNIGEKESQMFGNIDMHVNLFGTINVSNIDVNIIPKTKVIPLGNAVGLKLYTDGVLVVGMSDIEGEKPYENTGLEEGNRIISINDKKIEDTEDLTQTVNSFQGKEIEIKYINNENKEHTTNIIPVKTKDNEYKLRIMGKRCYSRCWNSNIL